MVRLIRYLSSCGIDSRRKCELIIRSGRISINGEKETNPFRILSKKDSIDFDGRSILPPNNRTTLILNKPAGIITTAKDTHDRKTVLDIIPKTNPPISDETHTVITRRKSSPPSSLSKFLSK